MGDYYDSHGCLHFSPSDIYLLAKSIPSGIPLKIFAYGDQILPFKTEEIKFFNEIVSSAEDINSAASYLKLNDTKLLVYPSLNRLYVVVNGSPYAQVKIQAGPPNYYRMVISLEKGKQIEWDFTRATPTDFGDYNILRSKSHYISPTYYQTTIIPFGARIKKSGYGWIYENNGKWYQIPKSIEEDASLPYGYGEFNYFDVQLDKYGNILSARWGSHDFGKYVLLWTKDGKNYYPELGYAEGQLVFEQIKLTEDLGDILTVPGPDDLDSCISGNKNFQAYRDVHLFIESKGTYISKNIDPAAGSYYKLFNKLKLSKEDYKYLDKRVIDAFNIFRNKQLPWLPWEKEKRERIIGLYYFARDYNLAFQKQGNWYKKIKDDWLFWKNLREKLREDFKKMGVHSPERQKIIVEGWLNDRLEFKKADPPAYVSF